MSIRRARSKALRATDARAHPVDPTPPVETVEAFLARGGKIERLDAGARGQPLTMTLRAVNAKNAARRLLSMSRRAANGAS